MDACAIKRDTTGSAGSSLEPPDSNDDASAAVAVVNGVGLTLVVDLNDGSSKR
jgi:hypothetical protein